MKAGISKVNITPPIGTPLGGYIARKGPAIGIHDSLWAEAFVIENHKASLTIVAIDLLGINKQLVNEIRKLAHKNIGAKAKNILIAATHTHSGPDLILGHQGKASKTYFYFLRDSIVGAIDVAWRFRSLAVSGVNQGFVESLGVNRRHESGLPIDPSVSILRFDLVEHKQVGILTNFACHPTVLGPDNLFISADYPGFMKKVVNKVKGTNFIVGFTNGAAGDVNPGHSAELSALGERIPGRTFERAEKLGTMLAGEVLKVLEAIEVKSDVALAVNVKKIKLPLRPLPSLKEARTSLAQKQKNLDKLLDKSAPLKAITKAKIEKLYAELLLRQVLERQKAPHKTSETVELQAMRIGDCALLAFPGELFVEIGLKIKAESPFKHTCIVGYANGYVGYIPTKEAFAEGGYEAVTAKFIPEASDIVVDKSLELLKSLV